MLIVLTDMVVHIITILYYIIVVVLYLCLYDYWTILSSYYCCGTQSFLMAVFDFWQQSLFPGKYDPNENKNN